MKNNKKKVKNLSPGKTGKVEEKVSSGPDTKETPTGQLQELKSKENGSRSLWGGVVHGRS